MRRPLTVILGAALLAAAAPPVLLHAGQQAPSRTAQGAADTRNREGTTSTGGLPATYLTSADVQTFLKALPADAISDLPIRVVDVGGYHVGVFGVFRPKSQPGDAIAHETRTTEIYYILDGSGTLVTGGTITDMKPPPPGRTAGPRGDRIEGGASRHVAAGDIIIIPGRTPHWWSSLDSDIHYLIYRPDPDGRLRLK
jgi:mannose-6-phosphate isomerase-like protein (cupin superfamily)